MPILFILLFIGALAIAAYLICGRRVLALAGGDMRKLHSLQSHYAWHGALWVLVPALAALALWLIIQPLIIEGRLGAMLPPEAVATDADRTLAIADIRRVAVGLDLARDAGTLPDSLNPDAVAPLLDEQGVALAGEVTAPILAAAEQYTSLTATGGLWRGIVTVLVAIAGLLAGVRLTTPDYRARNRVEQVVMGLLIAASLVAILTTVGIVLSMLSEATRFFGMYPIQDFFFGLTWSPNFRGNSALGLLPLLWGTLYITLVSMIVAIPLGLFAAIYLAEYATPRFRSIVKPAIEVIAGIPTVVFGLFALVTVGPFLRDWFAEPLGLGNSGSSVMTAGIVIGILNIPFISSLADDIINAVPQSLRDGSSGLGATKSETIRQVVLPAALPGIMGACLMAASRAIGETMIVTMGAGAAAQMNLNPFEAMTTITVKIVGQLTGDNEFDSPETLVAFALGITLFVITLGLNIWALWIVRKYREQYE
jgi:phosphate transport system permease protein